MANDYYNPSGYPTPFSFGSSSGLRAELASVAAGLDKLPALTGNGNRIPYVNGAGSAITSSSTFVLSSGNLGVGTATPSTKLDVVDAGDGGIQYRTGTRTTGLGQVSGEASVYWGSGTALTFFSGLERARFDGSGNLGIGTTGPTAKLDVNGNSIRLRTSKTPSSASDTGNAGDICWDSNYVYVCVATNTWKRSAIATW